MSHGILHYLRSAHLSKRFFQLVLSVFTFSQHFFLFILPGGKVWGYPTLLILWFINFKCWCLITSVKLRLISNLQKKIIYWNFKKVYLVTCGRLLVVCGRLLVLCSHLVVVYGCLLIICGHLWFCWWFVVVWWWFLVIYWWFVVVCW